MKYLYNNEVKLCNEQELVQSEPKSRPRNQNRKEPKLQIHVEVIPKGDLVNRMSNLFPKRYSPRATIYAELGGSWISEVNNGNHARQVSV